MKLLKTDLHEVVIIEPTVFRDDRGWFFESFNEPHFHDELSKLGLPIPRSFIQDNHSCSQKGVLRGLHYQLSPHAQGKLVRVVSGSAYDVVVDIRKGSPTFGNWAGVELSAKNHRMLWIPEGFAHGFVALEDNTHFLYKTTDVYNKELERSIKWDDPDIDIDWPTGADFIISEKDRQAKPLKDADLPTLYTPGSTQILTLDIIGDSRGSLIALEKSSQIPFEFRRVYYIFGTQPEVSRGFHAHKELRQLAVCVSGKCRMLMDNGVTKEEIWLDSPTKGVLINNLVWREMHDFTSDCVLVVFASHEYDERDYIRNYQEFTNLVAATVASNEAG
ncbi:dTDP-4-dehydrorhamnose 3,5-epimerase [Pseudomonas sp. NFACC15-1]|nr:dTDP-4-dehydrorhamnose 3,5-epimerase [Pseudomonas sp. NFACC15-1]SDW46785.1 dTDP-4-dehydrorhamnose 3,5-epimerase [Pseudomonas sp. NFACC14]